jgi:hypothetical protein
MLVRPRTLTPASLEARRANALKSTGPRTGRGKARVALNPLKHGRAAVNLPEKLVRAGYGQSQAEWRTIRARIARTFQPTFGLSGLGKDTQSASHPSADDPQTVEMAKCPWEAAPIPSLANLEKKMDRLANWVWCSYRSWQEPAGAKLKTSLESDDNETRLLNRTENRIPSQIRIHNPWARLGLVFYSQLRRGWADRLMTKLIQQRLAPGSEPAGPVEMEPVMEVGLRSRVYLLARPRFWEQIRFCLDSEGNYHPEWRGRYRQFRRELSSSPMAMWLEPHPILAALRREDAAVAGGV